MYRKRIQCLSNASQHVGPISTFNRFPVTLPLSLKVRYFSTLFFTFWPPWVRHWDNRGKCYKDRKRIQCLSNASLYIPIYLQPFLRYSTLLVENCDIFIPHLCLAAPHGVTPLEFHEDLDTHKTRMFYHVLSHIEVFSY